MSNTNDTLKEVRERIKTQLDTIIKLGGEWNAGYVEGLNYALDTLGLFIKHPHINEKQQQFDWKGYKDAV